MKREVEIWINELRNGGHPWGIEALQTKDGFCCLGVACLAAEKDGVPVNRDPTGELEGCDLADQPMVYQWLGIDKGPDEPWLFQNALIEANDLSETNPFKSIADIIEKDILPEVRA
jgi:hypothetical protein